MNDLPHIGSAYPTIACDFVAGHYKQLGHDVAFLTGTDEHGQKIEKSAKENSKKPQEHCDSVVSSFKDLWDLLEINNDYFVRTSDDSHKAYVSEFFRKVQEKGDIYKGEYKGLYCVSCEDFKLEKDLEEDENGELNCPIHKIPVEEYSQENYFFALSKYEQKLKDYIAENPDFISPSYRKNEVLGWLEEGLKDFPISRVGLSWGIDIPGDSDQKIYVWFDALLGYHSGLGSDLSKFWQASNEAATDELAVAPVTHVIGKDILRFHAVYWPAMLMSAGMPLPKKVFGHGFLTKDGMKMGKTLGNVVDPFDLVREFGADSVRFFFMREFPFGRDGDYSRQAMINRLNSDLANNLGNLLNRSSNLMRKYFSASENLDTLVAYASRNFTESQSEFLVKARAFTDSFSKSIQEINIYQALESVFESLSEANVEMSNIAPWTILKNADPSDTETIQAAFAVLYNNLELCRRAAICLSALTPGLAQSIFKQLSLLDSDAELSRDALLTGLALFANFDNLLTSEQISNILINKSKPVFERIADKEPA